MLVKEKEQLKKNVQDEITALKVSLAQRQEKRDGLSSAQNKLQVELREMQAQIQYIINESQNCQQKKQKAEYEIRILNLEERTKEEYQLDLSNLDATTGEINLELMTATQAETTDAVTPPIDFWESVSKEIEEFQGKVERLGNVNLEAIKEQDELE